MAFISYVPTDQASLELLRIYQKYGASEGGLDNVLRIHSHNPRSLETHYQLYRWLMSGSSPLSRAQREMIAVTVSSLNKCFY